MVDFGDSPPVLLKPTIGSGWPRLTWWRGVVWVGWWVAWVGWGVDVSMDVSDSCPLQISGSKRQREDLPSKRKDGRHAGFGMKQCCYEICAANASDTNASERRSLVMTRTKTSSEC